MGGGTLEDFLDVNALCGASVGGIATAAAAVAPYGAALHAACRHNGLLKNADAQANKTEPNVNVLGLASINKLHAFFTRARKGCTGFRLGNIYPNFAERSPPILWVIYPQFCPILLVIYPQFCWLFAPHFVGNLPPIVWVIYPQFCWLFTPNFVGNLPPILWQFIPSLGLVINPQFWKFGG